MARKGANVPKWSVLKLGRGAYRYLFPFGFNFDIVRSEDGDGWCINTLNDQTHKVLGEPERAPKFSNKRGAFAHAWSIIEAKTEAGR